MREKKSSRKARVSGALAATATFERLRRQAPDVPPSAQLPLYQQDCKREREKALVSASAHAAGRCPCRRSFARAGAALCVYGWASVQDFAALRGRDCADARRGFCHAVVGVHVNGAAHERPVLRPLSRDIVKCQGPISGREQLVRAVGIEPTSSPWIAFIWLARECGQGAFDSGVTANGAAEGDGHGWLTPIRLPRERGQCVGLIRLFLALVVALDHLRDILLLPVGLNIPAWPKLGMNA